MFIIITITNGYYVEVECSMFELVSNVILWMVLCYLFVFACNFSIDSINKIQNKYKIYCRDDSFHSEHIYQHLFPCISDQWTFRYK